MTGPLWCTVEIDIVSQLYFNKKRKRKKDICTSSDSKR